MTFQRQDVGPSKRNRMQRRRRWHSSSQAAELENICVLNLFGVQIKSQPDLPEITSEER